MSIGKSSIARAAGTTAQAKKEPAKQTAPVLMQIATVSVKYLKGYAPKTTYKAEEALVLSVKEKGVIVPILAAGTPDGKFYLLDGALRLDAAKQAELETLPAVILSLEDESKARALYKELKATAKKVSTEEETFEAIRAVKEMPYYLL